MLRKWEMEKFGMISQTSPAKFITYVVQTAESSNKTWNQTLRRATPWWRAKIRGAFQDEWITQFQMPVCQHVE